MIVVVGVVVVASGFCLGMLVGICGTNRLMRRRIHRNGRERQEIHAAFAELAAARETLAVERDDLECRRRMLDG